MDTERFEALVFGNGTGGKLLAWHLARSGKRTAVVERRWIGGSCPNVACLPSKNEIWSANVAHLVRHAAEFGTRTGPVSIDMAVVRQRKRSMVEGEIAVHMQHFQTSGAELILGVGRFVGPRTLEVKLNDGGTRLLAADQVFINVGTHAALPAVPGLADTQPLTHIEALELDRVPRHLIVLGGGYVGLELGQAYRRFGSRITVIERGPALMGREDPDVADEVRRILAEEGIEFLLAAEVLRAHGRSGDAVSVVVRTASGEQTLEGSDILAAAGRIPNTTGIGLEEAGIELDERGLHPHERAVGNDRAAGLGRRRVRRQPTVHACLGRRLPHHSGQSGGGRAQHARSHDPVLYVHRSTARARGIERTRGRAAGYPRPCRTAADERGAAHPHDG